jgi:GT2 family glycosyltransferase
LDSIGVFTATPEGVGGQLVLDLYPEDHSNPVLRSVRLPGRKVRDNAYTLFRFPPIRQSRHKRFLIELYATGRPIPVALYNPHAPPKSCELVYDGKRLSGCIGVRIFSSIRVLDPYLGWILKNEPTQQEIQQYRGQVPLFNYRPTISLVTPVYNTRREWLEEAIESVRNQIYPNWELCIADGNSSQPYVKEVLKAYAAQDTRIKVKFLGENKGIAGNSNEALSLASGEFIGFLDHDDILPSFALYEVVKLLNQQPDLDLIYSDEDKISMDSRERFGPVFKPGWSPDVLRSHNYICHFCVIRKSLIDQIKGFRQGYDGSQDYDLILRVIERTQRIAHIPKVLYHWRSHRGSAAYTLKAKSYACISTEKALRDHLARCGCKAKVSMTYPNTFRVRYNIIGNPKISIIIPSPVRSKYLKRCLRSIHQKTRYPTYEVIVVSETQPAVNLPGVRAIRYEGPFDFFRMVNTAVGQAGGEYVVCLHHDVEVISVGWLISMLEHAQRGQVGMVGACLYYPDKTFQHAGIILGINGIIGHSHRSLPGYFEGYLMRAKTVQNVSAVSAACLMIRKGLFQQLGGFDPMLSYILGDVDLALRVRKRGYFIVYTPYAELYHHEPIWEARWDTDSPKFISAYNYFQEKWGYILEKGDDYYSPNLSLASEDFSIKVNT